VYLPEMTTYPRSILPISVSSNEYTYPSPTAGSPVFSQNHASFPGFARLSLVIRRLTAINHNQQVRKIIAIAFISAFAFAQYAKQALYLECKLSNNFKSRTEKCDCATQAGLDKKETNLPLSKSHSHIHLDELFPARQSSYEFNWPGNAKELFSILNEKECEGDCLVPYHPPRLQEHITVQLCMG